MSNETVFHLGSDTQSVVQACLEHMKYCCQLEIPFYLSGDMQATIAVVQDCLKQTENCCELAEKLARLRSYQQERKTTKIMLLLMEYGSEDEFKRRIERELSGLGSRLKDLEKYLEGIGAKLNAGSYRCLKCAGSGRISKWTVIRERGDPPQSILLSSKCDRCSGEGQMPITTEVQKTLTLFYDESKHAHTAMGNFRRSLNDLMTTGYVQAQPEEEEKLKSEPQPGELGVEVEKEAYERTTTSAPKEEELSVRKICEKTREKPDVFSWPYQKDFFLDLLNLKPFTSFHPATDGTPTWWERRANRQYVCSICKKFIKKGVRYIGRKELRPGMRGPYGYRGNYFTNYYHIVCLLEDTEAEIEEKIGNIRSEINMLRSEVASFRNTIGLRRQQIRNHETLRQKAKKDYEDSAFWRKFAKWVSYHYTSRLEAREISRLEQEISHAEHREIRQREKRIDDLNERSGKLESWLRKIRKETQELRTRGL